MTPAERPSAYVRFAADLRMGHAALVRNLDTLGGHTPRSPDDRDRLLGLSEIYVRFLYLHHEGEDEVLFPSLRAHSAGRSTDAAFLDARIAEHRQVHRLLDAWRDELARARNHADRPIFQSQAFAREIQQLLGPHLAAEESVLAPEPLAQMLPEAEMERVLETIAKHIGMKGGANVVLLLVHSLSEQERAVLRAQTSWIFREVFVDRLFVRGFSPFAALTPYPDASL